MNKYAALLAFATLLAAPAIAKDKKTPPAVAPGTIILFNGQNLDGDWKEIDEDSPGIDTDWNVGSIAIAPGETWTICQAPVYRGNCMDVSTSMTKLGQVEIRSAKKKKS